MSKDDGRYVESEAVAEVNRKMEQWMQEQYAEMMKRFWQDGQVIKQPQWLQIFTATKEQIADVFAGRSKVTNIPKDAWLYDIRPWEHTQVLDVYAFWMVHPSFSEYRSGNCAPAYPMQFDTT